MIGFSVEPWHRTPSHPLLFRIARPRLDDFGMWVIARNEETDEVALQFRIELAYEDAFLAAREIDGVPFERNAEIMAWLEGAVWTAAVAVAESMLADGLHGEQHFTLDVLEPRSDRDPPTRPAPELIAV